MFKYFSEATKDSSDGWVRYAVAGTMAVPFALAFLGTVVGWVDLTRVSVYTFVAMLLLFSIAWIVTYYYHNHKF